MTEAAAVSTRPAASLRALLQGVVDYAGLFPPASLGMGAAVSEYAEHRASDQSWALGRFVLPAARLTEFEAESAGMLPREGARSWALSALCSTDLEEDVERIDAFNERHSDARQGAVLVDTVEIKTHTVRDVTRAGEMLAGRFDTYMEVPAANDPAEVIAAISTTRAKAKIRTGGVTAEAFPTAAEIVRFVARCIAHDVSFKATAGLHHPWRAEYRLTYAPDAASGTMFGFLNVLLAVAALRAGRDEETAIRLLESRDPDAVRFDREHLDWPAGGMRLSADDIRRARDSMTSFGSCSFRDPMGDLRHLGLL